MKKIAIAFLFFALVLVNGLVPGLFAQSGSDAAMQNMPGMGRDGANQVMHAMDTHHMDMGPHMKMTAPRAAKPGDQERAQRVLDSARNVAEKYRDYKVALADGFHIFMPSVTQLQYHFNNSKYAHEAAEHFNPEHPTSLLYEKDSAGYKLIGVMYTASRWTTEDELDQRVPLSIAQWHAHVNLCLPPSSLMESLAPAMDGSDPRFGPEGSISTRTECEAAGGRFVPQIFGWMVHVYPFEQKAEDIWSVERQRLIGLVTTDER